jgi:phage terminase large subunit-like protein
LQILQHPVYPLPSREQFNKYPKECANFILERNKRIEYERSDPYRFGFEPDIWKKVDSLWTKGANEVLILGGNRSSKSEYGGKLAIRKLLEKDNARVWCFQTNDKNSKEMQQPFVWKYVPLEYRTYGKKKDRVFNLSYSQKNGFSEGTFIFPNGSQCFFRHYSQEINTIEGGEVDFVWCDELVPQDWLDTIRFRLVTRGGILLVTFTPIEGYTPTVKTYLQGARTIESVKAALLADALVPRIQQPVRKNAKIVYFHTADNPFGGYENLKKTLQGANRSEILCRAYGVPAKAAVEKFPKFREEAHVLAASKIPKKGTRYQIVDPCSGRNWFMCWCIVDARERMYFYREWPSPGQYIPGIGDPGVWAEPHGRLSDGAMGPAQRGFGWGLKRYKEEIERLETSSDNSKEQIEYRIIDSRYANSTTITKETATTLIQECEEIGLTFAASPNDSIDEGVALINSKLDYDKNEDTSYCNEPTLYFSENCPNMIFAMKEWTGEDGKSGATKDPIDCVRYAVLSALAYIDEEEFASKPNCYALN